MFKIKFTLGDWSGDGHGKNSSYIYESNKSVEEVREIHFKFKDMFSFDIGSLCRDYGESWITKETYYKLQDIIKWPIDPELNDEWWAEEENRYHPEKYELSWFWAKGLMAVDKTLILIEVDDTIPTLHFFGYDNQGRHLHTPGYGLFE